MSLMLRSLLRDPLMTRPLSRALRRYDNDWWADEAPRSVRRRYDPIYHSPDSLIDDMNRQMTAAMNRMHEFAQDLDSLDALVGRFEDGSQVEGSRAPRRRRGEDTMVRRTESGGLQVALDVKDFKPEELKIKLVDDNLIVEAESESSAENSYRKSQFKRWFKLPEDCKLEEIRSKFTQDHKLLIDLPSNKPIQQDKGRTIPIEMEKPAQGKDAPKTSSSQEGDAKSNQH